MTSHPAALTEVLAELATKIRRYQDKPIGEQDTKASLIEPLLECLGWDIRDLDSVHREYRTKPRDNPVDYALMLLRRPHFSLKPRASARTSRSASGSPRCWVTPRSPGCNGAC